MRIETNFAAPVPRLTRQVGWASAVLAFALAAGITGFWLDAAARNGDILESIERLRHLETRRAALGALPDLPSAAEMSAIRERVATVNALSVTRGRRLTALLALFEELLPADAWLVSLHHKARDGEIVLVAEADRAEPLTQFLLQLEKSSRFAEVLLLRQSPFGVEGRRIVQFELRLRERS